MLKLNLIFCFGNTSLYLQRFIKYISGKNDSKIRLGGTLASSIHAMMNGVQIMRVHDFNEISQGLKVFKSINK